MSLQRIFRLRRADRPSHPISLIPFAFGAEELMPLHGEGLLIQTLIAAGIDVAGLLIAPLVVYRFVQKHRPAPGKR